MPIHWLFLQYFQLTKYEIETPLGFAILVHNQIGQFEALMGSLFRPQNSYCIYVDQKTSEEFKGQVEIIVGNYKAMFPQVTYSLYFIEICY